ncbi:MAG: NAD(P)-dependent oxidoreductase [Candidatus Azobacteroides sp.]|nr:NAD(P)-dependent oxidoreductase [Candidatus Azobacteroides sp.]
MKKILITGAAGNLGGLLADYLKETPYHLNLLTHHRPINGVLSACPNVSVYKADLAKKETLLPALSGVDTIVHFAGVLFMHHPEKFLPVTNTGYFKNLLEEAVKQEIKRIILISFPHVEGESFPDKPATGILHGNPISVHASTRLEEEKLLFRVGKEYSFEAVSLRLGMVYGRGILMMDAARWFSKHHLLGIWKKPTWIHLISVPDYLEATKQAIIKENIQGIYHIGDEGVQTLQEFLDACSVKWKSTRPIRMPVKLIMTAAGIFEFFSKVFGVKSPLTRDFIKIGMVSYYGDTTRMRNELLPELTYRTFREGMKTI